MFSLPHDHVDDAASPRREKMYLRLASQIEDVKEDLAVGVAAGFSYLFKLILPPGRSLET